MMIRIVAKPPSECSDVELDAFCALVCSEAQVNLATLSDNVGRAKRLCFAFEGDELAGVAAIKVALPSYRKHVKQKAEARIALENIPHEFGYVVVAPNHRGKKLSQSMAAALLESDPDSIYATSTTDNDRMHKTLERHGFVREGNPYKSTEHPEKQLALFIREVGSAC